MVRTTCSTKISPAMVRSAFGILVASVCVLCSAAAAHAQVSATELLTRIDRLEAAIRDLTGTTEQLQYRNQQLEQQVRRLQEELEARSDGARLSAASPRASTPYSPPPAAPPASATASAVPPAVAPPAAPPPYGRRGDAFDPNANPAAPGVPRPLGSSTAATEPPPVYERPQNPPEPAPRSAGAPLNLSTLSSPPTEGNPAAPGELPPPPPRNSSATGALASATLPPGNSPKDEYDLGYGYVLHKDYGLAANTFRNFLQQYPSDRLAARGSILARRKPLSATAISRRRRIVPRRLDQIRGDRAGAGSVVAAWPVARGLGRKGSGLRLARRGAAQISARLARA